MTEQEIQDKIKLAIKQTQKLFGSRHGQYDAILESYRQAGDKAKVDAGERGIWERKYKRKFWSITAEEIINNEDITGPVAGCNGVSQAFYYFAKQLGLQDLLSVVSTKVWTDWVRARARFAMGAEPYTKDTHMNGHQLMAVKMPDGTLRAFEPGRLESIKMPDGKRKNEIMFIDGKVKVGNRIKAVSGHPPYLIVAVTTPEYRFNNVTSYERGMNMSTGGDPDKFEFTIIPQEELVQHLLKKNQNG
ncbi:MAG: hypothetical protein FWE64_00445 [Alphaproteobacteria bacterium]|nr:hypothetical protein [Alphaproteobacteria bacterium]